MHRAIARIYEKKQAQNQAEDFLITESTGEIVARIGAEQASKGIKLPLGDLIIGACALELGYAVGTGNVRDFNCIPGLTVVRL